MKRKIESTISDEVKAIRSKLEVDEGLTTKEKKLEVGKDKAAFLLSVLAGRTIEPEYIKQLTRGDAPRLLPSRALGNTYLYTVESLLDVKFTRAHKKMAEGDNAV